MKRNLCPQHSYGRYKKPVMLTNDDCSLCRWENRPYTLLDFANALNHISEAMRIAAEDEYYDPHGITYAYDFNRIITEWFKNIHESYRNRAIKEMLEELKYEL